MNATRLLELLDRMKTVRALVAGDSIIDHYVFGRSTRICPEAPVPVFVPEREESRHGGALNVKNQLDALCQPAWQWVSSVPSRKTRLMVGSHLVLRIDEDRLMTPNEAAVADIEARLDEANEKDDLDVILLSDYAKGWLGGQTCQYLINAARVLEIPVVVDPKGINWAKYAGASVICPNEAEWNAVNAQAPAGSVIISKHGDKGLVLFKNEGSETTDHVFPATARHVADVTGAGDTVVAVVAAVLGAGGTYEEACVLANLAAGHVVGEVGTAICTAERLRELVSEHFPRIIH